MKRCCLRITPDRLLLEMAPPGPTDHIAAVACRANVDRRGAVGRVLGDERRDVEVAQIIDELVHIVSLVGAPRVRRRDPGEWRTTIVTAASRSIVPVAEPIRPRRSLRHTSRRPCGRAIKIPFATYKFAKGFFVR
jgi:hypothetical protein